jgi:putative SOS response-associated peptidase YedK
LVPANGYYEWQRQGSIKQPYYISPDNSNLMAFAGLWDRRESGDEPMETFTIITTAANDATRPVHDRMPVILDPSHYELWLEKGDSSLLRPFDGPLRVWPVSRRVNSPANDGADLTAPLSAAEPAAGR